MEAKIVKSAIVLVIEEVAVESAALQHDQD